MISSNLMSTIPHKKETQIRPRHVLSLCYLQVSSVNMYVHDYIFALIYIDRRALGFLVLLWVTNESMKCASSHKKHAHFELKTQVIQYLIDYLPMWGIKLVRCAAPSECQMLPWNQQQRSNQGNSPPTSSSHVRNINKYSWLVAVGLNRMHYLENLLFR